jgi:hypothetical protein
MVTVSQYRTTVRPRAPPSPSGGGRKGCRRRSTELQLLGMISMRSMTSPSENLIDDVDAVQHLGKDRVVVIGRGL